MHLPGASDLSLDAVYTHDPSLATDHGLIGLHPGKHEPCSRSAASPGLLPERLAFPRQVRSIRQEKPKPAIWFGSIPPLC